MVQESWRLLQELLGTGQMTLGNGKIVVPSPELMVRAIQDIAKLKPPKVRKIAVVEDFRPAKTVGG